MVVGRAGYDNDLSIDLPDVRLESTGYDSLSIIGSIVSWRTFYCSFSTDGAVMVNLCLLLL